MTEKYLQAVLLAVKYINLERNVLAMPRTIASFLKGAVSSPYYCTFFKKHPDVCGLYASTSDAEVINACAALCRRGLLDKTTRNGELFYQHIAIKVRTSKRNVAVKRENFFNGLSVSEAELIAELKQYILSLRVDLQLEDKKTYMGFRCPVIDDGYHPFWFRIRRNKFGKLEAVLRDKPESPDKPPIPFTKKKLPEIERQIRFILRNDVDDIESVRRRIVGKDAFADYFTQNQCDLPLMSHQIAGAEIAEQYNRFGFFYDTGTGKTLMALEIMMNKEREFGTHFLVIAPKPLIKSAWLDDAKHFKDMRLLPLSKNMRPNDYADLYDLWFAQDDPHKRWRRPDPDEFGDVRFSAEDKKKLFKTLEKHASHYIVNIDLIREPKKSDEFFKKYPIEGIIIDESAILKNYDSKQSRRVRVLSKKKRVRFVYLLSGKPAPNTTQEYYSQMKIVDPDTFSMTANQFLNLYYKQTGSKWVIKNQHAETAVTKMIANRSLIVKKEECLDLPKKISQTINVELNGESRSFYSDVMRNMVTEIIDLDGNKVRSRRMGKLARITKLREIASGFYQDRDNRFRVSFSKISALMALLDDIGDYQVLIWCNFQFELEEIERHLKQQGKTVVTAYGKSGNRLDDNIAAFKDGTAQYMVANPKTLKYGVTFTKCHYAVFNSLSYSYEDYYQAHDRIYRKGQTSSCVYYHLLTEDTIDQIIYDCIEGKHKRSEIFERLIKKASRFGVGKDLIRSALQASSATKALVLSAESAEVL